jgi:hypothetical protein
MALVGTYLWRHFMIRKALFRAVLMVNIIQLTQLPWMIRAVVKCAPLSSPVDIPPKVECSELCCGVGNT